MKKNADIHSLTSQITNRRDFVKNWLSLTTNTCLLTSCIRNENILGTSLLPGPRKTTIAFFGDSLTAGTGGTPYGNFVGKAMPNTTIAIIAIGGQTSEQICARQGGIPIIVSVEGGAFFGVKPVKIIKISTKFLSTPASYQQYVSKGTLAGVNCTMKRVVKFGTPNVETYTVIPTSSSNAPIPAGSIFVPEESIIYKDAIQVLWMGRNNNATRFVEDAMAYIEASISHIEDPKRFVVLGVLTATNETQGTVQHSLITQLNDQLKTKYSGNFVEMTPPTTNELKSINYLPSETDNIEISNGTFPRGLRSDRIHLNNSGYQLIANRLIAKLNELNY